jgi:hypothetical protein
MVVALSGVTTASSAPSPARPITAAIAKTRAGALGGNRKTWVHRGSPIVVRFVPQARFAVGIVLVNRARQKVTLERVRAIRRGLLPLLQIGTRITQHSLPTCDPHLLCLYPIRSLVSPPFRAVRTVPRPLRPGHNRVVQLNFRFGACDAMHDGSAAPIRRLLITYRTQTGVQVHQRLDLGDSTIRVTAIRKKNICHVLP